MLSILTLSLILAGQSASTPALRVVVIEGEDAVNIVQQQTAVRPVVEVRDRNNLPVAGAVVTFSIEGGKAASFGGVSTLTVATNAAGQAAVTGMTPATAGAFQIQVSAAFQGQVATATIAQTNVMTAAQAAAAGAATGSGSAGSAGGGGAGSAGGAAGGAGGGGLSATTIGIVAAAVGGGALAATQLTKDDGAVGVYTGPFTGQAVFTSVNRTTGQSCVTTHAVTATMEFKIHGSNGDRVDATWAARGTERFVSDSCGRPFEAEREAQYGGDASGPGAAIRGSASSPCSRTTPQGDVIQCSGTVTFEGALQGEDTVVATVTLESRGTSTSPAGIVFDNMNSARFQTTATKTR